MNKTIKNIVRYYKPGVLGKLRYFTLLLLTAIMLLGILTPAPVKAYNIAMSGSFYRHHYKLVPGESTITPDIYVVVFNHDDTDAIKVNLTPQAPPDVTIYLSESSFIIPANGEHSVEVGVEVGINALPGDYIITITADIESNGEGIVIAGAAQQQSKLTVMGEAGTVRVSLLDRAENPLPAEVRVCRKEDTLHPCAFSYKGELEARLAPGNYLAHAYLNEVEIAREEFTLLADEIKQITLIGDTTLIYGFSAVPYYYEDTGKIAFTNVVYNFKNIYQPLPDFKAILKVSLDGKLIGEDEIISLPVLDIGDINGSYKYVPTQGWKDGSYTFKVEGYSQGLLYAQSQDQNLEVSEAQTSFPWLIVIVPVAGVIVIGLIVWLMARRRKKTSSQESVTVLTIDLE